MGYLHFNKKWRPLLCGVLLFSFATASAQSQTISGTVSSGTSNQPLPGVSVQVKGTSKGAVSAADGKFTIAGVSPTDTLVFSDIGFITQKRLVGGNKTMDIALQENKTELNELIVTGYRSQTRGSVTGSITSVSGNDLKDAPYDNLSNALAGRLSGVTISQSSGTPGEASSIRVRAQGTFNNADPLYVIDGVVSDKFQFDGLSPSEVKSITVLKDGASAAIYGSRAANGVVLVTTKKGEIGKPVFTYTGIVALQNPTQIPKVFNAYQHAKTINDALHYNSIPSTDARYYTPDELDYFKTHSWDWLNTLWKTPLTTQHTMSVSGGSEKVTYFMNGDYNYTTGSFNNLNYQKFGIAGNVNVHITKDFTVGLDLNADRRNTNGPSWQVSNSNQEDLYKAILIRPTMVPPYINGLPVGNWVEWHPGVVTTPNLAGYNKNEWAEINSTITLNYNLPFVKGLSVKAYINGYKKDIYNKQFNLPYDMTLFNTSGGHNHIVGDSAVGIVHRAADEFLQSRYDKIERYQFDAQINYARSFGKNNINALLVYEQAEEDHTWFNARRDNFISTAIDQYIAGSPVDPHADGSESQTARISYVGLVSYNYADKYLLETSFRYDGSVIFAPDRRWGFFPSVSAGWRISNEPFFKKNIQFINDLKLRASVALVGNDDVGAFQYQQSYNIEPGAIFDAATNGLEPGTLANPDITWEKSRSYNAGLDSRFLNHFSLTLDLFYRHTYDILGSRQLSTPSTFGATLPDENYEQVNTKGFEIGLGYNNQFGSAGHPFTYYARANFGYATNKVVRLDQAENIRPYQSKIGLPIDPIFGYVATNIIRTQKDISTLPAGYTVNGVPAELGMLNYKDIRGPNSDKPDGKITSDDEQYIAKYSFPPMDYGLSLGISWRSFSVDALVQGTGGGYVMLPTTGRDVQARAEEASFAYWADSWTPDNPNGKYPGYRGTSYRTRYPESSFWLLNDTYVRLKNLSISYSLPNALLQRLNVDNIKFFFTGTNLLMLYRVNKLYDPEQHLINSYPIMTSYSFGLNITL
jgi:TonB-linked SusC/RagA family outer membrane protein